MFRGLPGLRGLGFLNWEFQSRVFIKVPFVFRHPGCIRSSAHRYLVKHNDFQKRCCGKKSQSLHLGKHGVDLAFAMVLAQDAEVEVARHSWKPSLWPSGR